MKHITKNGAYSSLKKVMIHWGFGDIDASVYAILALNREEMTAKEIAEESGYAYSSVVNSLNHLRRYYLVERDKKGKCYSYKAVIDFVKILKNERRLVVNLLKETKETLKDGTEKYEEIMDNIEKGIKYLGEIEKKIN